MRMTEVRNMPQITRPIEANPGVSDFQAMLMGPLCYVLGEAGDIRRAGIVRNGHLVIQKCIHLAE